MIDLDMENVSTVPVLPLDHPSLAAEIMRMDRERRRGPVIDWLGLLLLFIALAIVLSGAYLIALGLSL